MNCEIIVTSASNNVLYIGGSVSILFILALTTILLMRNSSYVLITFKHHICTFFKMHELFLKYFIETHKKRKKQRSSSRSSDSQQQYSPRIELEPTPPVNNHIINTMKTPRFQPTSAYYNNMPHNGKFPSSSNL